MPVQPSQSVSVSTNYYSRQDDGSKFDDAGYLEPGLWVSGCPGLRLAAELHSRQQRQYASMTSHRRALMQNYLLTIPCSPWVHGIEAWASSAEAA